MSHFISLTKVENKVSKAKTRINFDHVIEYSDRGNEHTTTLKISGNPDIIVEERPEIIDELLKQR